MAPLFPRRRRQSRQSIRTAGGNVHFSCGLTSFVMRRRNNEIDRRVFLRLAGVGLGAAALGRGIDSVDGADVFMFLQVVALREPSFRGRVYWHSLLELQTQPRSRSCGRAHTGSSSDLHPAGVIHLDPQDCGTQCPASRVSKRAGLAAMRYKAQSFCVTTRLAGTLSQSCD